MPNPRTKNQDGQIILISIVFFAIMLTLSGALLGYVGINVHSERQSIAAAQALHLAEAGIEKAIYQLNQDPTYSGESNTSLGNGQFTIALTNIDSDTKRITSTATVQTGSGSTVTKTIKVNAAVNANVISFHYGIQAGDGGFTLANSSSITGNVFSSGPVVGSGNMIYGDVISSNVDGWVYGIHATGTVYSHIIGKAGVSTTIDKDAYYQTLTNTTVSGTKFPGSPDQSDAPLPISDTQISQWEGYAAAGGTLAQSSCDSFDSSSNTCTISSNKTLGPIKIPFNLLIKSASGVLNVTGPIWVVGNITTQTGPTIKIDSSLGNQNVAIIADNSYNPAGSGIITIGQSTQFFGSGSPNSFVFLISQNNSAETGGITQALSLNQGASALVAYASHGLISLSQSVSVKETTAYKIMLSQSANVTYDTGLPNTLFQSGPGGSWSYTPGTYVIVK